MRGRSLTSALLLQELESLEKEAMLKYVHSFTSIYKTWQQIFDEKSNERCGLEQFGPKY